MLLGKADSGKLKGYFDQLDLVEFCQRLVKSMQLNDGKILVESQEGVGSCFTVILPIQEDTF